MKKKTITPKNEKVYYDPNDEGALGGVKRFNEQLKLKNEKSAKTWLQTQPAYSLHKPIRKKFPTRSYQTSGLNDLWQMDLMEMIPYARINKGYKYILNCIDVFSRYVRAYPLKSKNGEEVSMAIKTMLKNAKPRYIQTDLGKEFYNKHVKNVFDKFKIKHYTVNSQFKAAHVERFNRTLREKLSRWFTHNGNKIWYQVLQQLVDTYNKSKHRGIFHMRPIDITNKNEHELWERQQPTTTTTTQSRDTIPLLQYVRISRITNSPFIKNFDQNWSEEVFQVVGVDTKSQPIMYILRDMKNNVISGKFYKEELQDIGTSPPNVFRIEKILRSKGKGAYKQYFVKWHGYDSSQNSWVSASSITQNAKHVR